MYSTAIERDLSWREQELASLKRMAIANRLHPVSYRSALRALWAMLYAHYEGFTKFCWDVYLDELQIRKVPRSKLSESLRILSLEDFFSRLRGDTSTMNIWRVFSGELKEHLEEAASFPRKCRLSAESNLWPDVFRRETSRIGIVCHCLDENEIRLKTLVARRNDIAHGEKMTVTSIEDYEPFEHAALMIMHELAILVLQHLEQDAFLSETSQMGAL